MSVKSYEIRIKEYIYKLGKIRLDTEMIYVSVSSL